MRCQVCGNYSGKYPLCKTCNNLKERGIIVKCSKCGNWHSKGAECRATSSDCEYLYQLKRSLMTRNEQNYYAAILKILPSGYLLFPQVNLAAFITRTDNFKYRNELFRNVDFLITDDRYAPKAIIEINDNTHTESDRKERDQKVKYICEEAGIPIVKLWTSYGIDSQYIHGCVQHALSKPITRISHLPKQQAIQDDLDDSDFIDTNQQRTTKKPAAKGGCYVATCVYGSYDCPEVWVLRRYRDYKLHGSVLGRLFIKCYYAISPVVVKILGNNNWFKNFFKPMLDKKVNTLKAQGYEDTPYYD